jgi:hypothetical protein
MFELTINNKVYNFNFGLGFIRELNPKVTKAIDGVKGKVQELGLQYAIGGIIDGDIEDLINVLLTANKGCEGERLTIKELEAHIEDSNTDLDGLFEQVLDFLSEANCTKKAAKNLQDAIEQQRAKAESEQTAK